MKKTIFILVLLAVATIATAQTNVDLRTLLREFDNNAVRVNQQYRGSTVRLSGVVTAIISDRRVNLGPTTNNPLDIVVVEFNSSERGKVLNLNKGQRITIRGTYVGDPVFPFINRAVIETTPPPSTSQQTRPQLRFDGYYRMHLEYDLQDSLRFFEDGTVVAGITGTNSDSRTVMNFLIREGDSNYITKGRYLVTNTNISFTLVYSNGNTYNYKGIITSDGDLRIENEGLYRFRRF